MYLYNIGVAVAEPQWENIIALRRTMRGNFKSTLMKVFMSGQMILSICFPAGEWDFEMLHLSISNISETREGMDNT